MPVSGLVVTLAEDPKRRDTALARLAAEVRVTRGEAVGARLPVVVDVFSVDEHDATIERIEDVEGVLFVELVFTDFSDVESVDHPPRRRRRTRPREV